MFEEVKYVTLIGVSLVKELPNATDLHSFSDFYNSSWKEKKKEMLVSTTVESLSKTLYQAWRLSKFLKRMHLLELFLQTALVILE